jgi:hypothetical protein
MRIISGGQTGVDRAALDFAIAYGVPHGGWCPRGRRAEDGVIPDKYQLTETPTEEYAQRTDRNVADADATLIIAGTLPLTGGTRYTLDCALRHAKPHVIVTRADGPEKAAASLRRLLTEHQPQVLNVAGPRESEEPGIGQFARQILEGAVLPN